MARVPFVAQMAAEECAPACLTMVLGALGHHVPLAEVRDRCGAGRSGTTAFNLLMAAKSFGLEGEGFGEVEPTEVADLLGAGPVILHWGLGHMVVCEQALKHGLRILDPALGQLEVGWDEAGRKMSGVVLTFRRTASFQLRSRGRRPLAAYLSEVAQARRVVLVLGFAGLLAQGIAVLPSLAVGMALDQGVGSPSGAALAGIGGLALAALTGNLLDLFRGLLAAKLAARENERFYGRVLERLLALPLGWLQARGAGEVMVSLTQIQRVLGDTATALLGLVTAIFSALACLLVLCMISPLVAAYAMTAGALLVWAAERIGERERIRKRPFLLATGRLGNEAVEVARALPWIEMAGLSAWARDRLVARVKGWRGHVLVAGEQTQLAGFQVGALLALVNAGLIGLAGWVGLAGGMSLGQVAVTVALGAVLVTVLSSLGGSLRALRGVANTLDRADDILQAEGERRGTFDGTLDGGVVGAGLRFAYWAGAEPVVKDLDFEISPGEMVGLVGASGCGKSTLGALIAGVRLPDAGELRLSGVATSAWDERALRRQVGYALQSPEVLTGTVRLNLELGHPASDEALWAALECACLDRKVRAIGGLEARLDPGGQNLSGGERQRLALARALVGKPMLLVLDEATSALELPIEAEIHKNLRSLNATRLLISHRRGSLVLADRVLELKEGRLV